MDAADSLADTLAVFERANPPSTPQTTSEVADELDCSRRTAYNRLERLAERGDLETKKVGARGRIWWRPPDRTDSPSADSSDSPNADSADSPSTDSERTEGRLRESKRRFQSLVKAVEEYAIFRLDTDGTVVSWNEGAERIKGYERDEIVGDHFSAFYTDEDVAARVPERNLADAAENGSAEDEGWRVRADGSRFWANVTITAIRGDDGELEGFAKVTRDMTEERQRQRQLRTERNLLDRVLETSPVGIAVFDPDGSVERSNERMADLFGVTSDDLGGYEMGNVTLLDEDGDSLPREAKPAVAAAETGDPVFDREVQVEVPDEGTRWLSVDAMPLEDADGELERVVATASDVTQLKEQARRLERQREDLRHELDDVFERIDDAFLALDEDLRVTYVNERAESLLDATATDLLGRRVWSELELGPKAERTFEEALRSQETASFEGFSASLDRWFEAHVYPSDTGLSVYFRDVSDRKQFEETLKSLHDTSRDLLAAGSREEVGRIIVDAVTEVLDLPGVVVYRHDAPDDRLRPAERSVEAEVVPAAFPAVPDDDGSITGGAFASGSPVHHDDIRDVPNLNADPDETWIRAGSFVPMGDHGVLVVGSRDPGEFDHRTRQLVELLGANAEAAYDRVAREVELVRRREQLTALNNLHAVVRDINEALVQQSTREQVEQVVCDRLADAESYEFAWFGAVDVQSETVELTAEAGVENYLDGVTISVNPSETTAQGPTGRAVQTEEMQVTTDVLSDPDYEPWREEAAEYGFRSSAAIPVAHDGSLYGVLNLYSARPGAFEGEERRVVRQLGEVVGHAIASIERKRALMSDEMVELEFRIRDVFEAVGLPESEGSISFERAVPVGDDEFIEYGTATGDAMETLTALPEKLPHWVDVTPIGERFGATTFEARLSEPPVISAVASAGGYIESATVEDGDYRMTLHFPPTVEVRNVVERVREAYPTVEVVTRRQVSRASESLRRLDEVLTEELTERQRTALEAAFFAGFFEWPRESSAQEVAESLDVSDATFHQHVRLAEKKLLSALFEEPATSIR